MKCCAQFRVRLLAAFIRRRFIFGRIIFTVLCTLRLSVDLKLPLLLLLQPKIELEKSIVKHINLLARKLHRWGKFILRELRRRGKRMSGELSSGEALKVVQLNGFNCHGWHTPRVCCHTISTVVHGLTPRRVPCQLPAPDAHLPLHFISDNSSWRKCLRN